MKRYSKTAIALHWIMAIIIIFSIVSGFLIYLQWVKSESFLFDIYQWHKSLGVVALGLFCLRLIWRFTHKPPQLIGLSNIEARKAKLGHIALYCLMLAMPVSGWLMVSSSDTGIPTIVFDLFKFPHFPIDQNKNINFVANQTHFYLSICLALLVLGHISLAIIHQRNGIKILQRIMPRSYFNYLGLGAVSIGLLLALFNNGSANKQKQITAQIPSITHSESALKFSGVHAEKLFKGVFKQWHLVTDYQTTQKNLQKFVLTIQTASAYTGNPFYDETLKEDDWLDVKNHPEIVFIGNNFKKTSSTTFQINGNLNIKNISQPLTITVNTEVNGLSAKLTLSRLKLGIGVAADQDAEWVNDAIDIHAFWKSK